jgi:hypothetical protein
MTYGLMHGKRNDCTGGRAGPFAQCLHHLEINSAQLLTCGVITRYR